MIGAQEFLDLIHGPGATIYFQVGTKTWKHKPQTFRQAESILRWRNDLGEDICFVVNSGGTQDAQINTFNAVFIDWDCGRNEKGHYFSEDEARARKIEYLPTLTAFALQPSITVETRNGYHAYWFLEPGVTPDQFRVCQRGLADALKGDSVVTNPARVMRLPGFDWVKPASGCARFPVSVFQYSGVRYRLEDILNALPQVKPKAEVAISAHSKCKCISTLALIVGANRPSQSSPQSFTSVNDALEYLKTRDLGTYLSNIERTPDEGQKIRCPFHADSIPSAGVYRAQTTNHWMFKCHACDISGTIIDMAMKIHGCSKARAIKILFEHYSIEIDTGWKAQQRQLLRENSAVISDTQLLKDRYPSLYRLIGRIRSDLRSKLRIAQASLTSERSHLNGNAVFFCSLRNFHRTARGETEHPKYCNRQNEKVDRYCLLGLMRKLHDDEIDPLLLKDAIARRMKLVHKFRIQFYSFPQYSTEVLQQADDRASRLIASGASVRGLSPELIHDVFGPEIVREVYPQLTDFASSSTTAFRAAVSNAVASAVADKGYATTKQLRDVMRRQGEWPSVTTRRIEKCLPGILAALNLVKRICDRQLKERLGITAFGYPKVIVPKNNRY